MVGVFEKSRCFYDFTWKSRCFWIFHLFAAELVTTTILLYWAVCDFTFSWFFFANFFLASICLRRGVLHPAQTVEITGGGGNQPAPGNRTVTMGFKFKTPMTQRYNEDNSTLSTRNDLILVFLAGNNSDSGASTGISGKFYFQSYYQDA